MSSCSTAEKGTSALDYVQEEPTSTAAGSCSSNLLLNSAPGYTAPPPTPMAAGAAPPDHHSLSSSTGSCSAVPTKFTHDDDPEFVADADEKAHKISTQLAAPTRADLDALAHYLMQQSLLSTPTLCLASPRSQQRKRRSLTCSSGPPGEVAAIAGASTIIDIDGTSIGEEEVTNGKRLSIIRDEHVDATGAAAAPVFSYVCGSTMSMGFREESRQGISKACQEMGAFYINVARSAVQEMNYEQSDAEALLPVLLRCSSNIMHVGSGPLVPLSENLIMINPALQATSSSCTRTMRHRSSPQEAEMIAFELLDPETFPADTNFRETMKKNAKLLFDVSKDVVKLLLEDLCVHTQTNIRGHSLKTLLFMYNSNGKHEKKAHDDDVVLSLSHGILNHKDNKNVSLLAKVGKQLQTWSKGKYKATSIHSLYNVACGEICMQLDLVEHH